MPEANNVDDILIMGKSSINQPIQSVIKEVEQEPVKSQIEQSEPINPEVQDHKDSNERVEETETKKEESNIDEYGNTIEKPKLYTQEEVQNMIRDRVSKIKNKPSNDEYQRPSEIQQTNDQQQDDDWQKQLKAFNDQWFEQKQRELDQRKWQQEEEKKQIEFESKFNVGMDKYSDFHNVVSSKPITDYMLMGIRHLDNPAACVYTASKLHPAELERISKISDPYVQASEMGRLHERMIKERKVTSSASKPLENYKGDMPIKNPETIPTNISSKEYQNHIDRRINEYAKQKFKR